MPDLAAIIQNFFETSTTLEALLAAVAVVALLTAGVGWVLRMNHRTKKARGRAGAGPGRRSPRAAANGYDDWNVEGGIIFPSGGGDHRRERHYVRQSADERGSEPDGESIFEGGFEGIAASGERAIEAVRERPLEYLAGAVAAGFAVGLLLPIFTSTRQIRLLERLVEANEERSLTQLQREAERFRQARQK
jgi:hypothetical protein